MKENKEKKNYIKSVKDGSLSISCSRRLGEFLYYLWERMENFNPKSEQEKIITFSALAMSASVLENWVPDEETMKEMHDVMRAYYKAFGYDDDSGTTENH